MSILQAMSGVAVPTAVVPTVAAPVIMPQPDASGSQIAGSNQPALSPADAISLLKDMQSLIDQLQQALQLDGQAADAQNTAGPLTSAVMPTPGTTQSQGQMQESAANAGATFQQLIDALQTDNAALAQMLKPQSTGNAVLDLTQMLKPQNAGSVISGTSVPSPLTASSDSAPVNQALLNSIAQVKGQLQQLQAANDAFFQQAQSDFHAQFAQALSSMSQASSTSGQDSGIAAASAAALPDNRNGAVAAAAQPVSQTVINLAGAMAVAPAATSQGNTGGGTGDNGSGQSQPAPLPVTASSQPASSQPAPAGNVAMVSFARVLNQASAPASLLDQVTFNVKTASTDGSSKIHIQLEPADLGKLDIQLNVGTDGKTGVIITADNKNTLALLQRDTAGLMRALSDAGLSTSSGNLSFSLGGGQQQQFAGGQQPASHAAANYQSAQPEDDLSIPMVSQTYAVSLTQGLDITI